MVWEVFKGAGRGADLLGQSREIFCPVLRPPEVVDLDKLYVDPNKSKKQKENYFLYMNG